MRWGWQPLPARGAPVTAVYPAGQLQTLLHPDGSEERFAWNAQGQLAVHHDPLGSETRWQYNLLGQLVSITDRIQRTRRHHYNCRGWLTNIENGNGGDYHFSYDAVGRLKGERRPDRLDRFYRYGLDGQLTEYREVASPDVAPQLSPRLHQ